MKLKSWLVENIFYRFCGCAYNRLTMPLFDAIEKVVPDEFVGRAIVDLGCGDGSNTLRLQKILKARDVVGCDNNAFLLARAGKRGLRTQQTDLSRDFPSGELAAFTYSLHHLDDKRRILEQAVRNFDYVFLCEPGNDLLHAIFDSGSPLSHKGWIGLFDEVMGSYRLHIFGNNIVVFFSKSASDAKLRKVS